MNAPKELCKKLCRALGVFVKIAEVLGQEEFLMMQALDKWFYSFGITRTQWTLDLSDCVCFSPQYGDFLISVDKATNAVSKYTMPPTLGGISHQSWITCHMGGNKLF